MSDNSSGANASGGIGLVTVILALIFLFVWPGPFRYEFFRPSVPELRSQWPIVKIDRISHQVWQYNWNQKEWERMPNE